MKILINYADSRYAQARKWNSRTGKLIAKFDTIYEFSPNDIDDKFQKENRQILLSKRGNGLWTNTFVQERKRAMVMETLHNKQSIGAD